MKAITLHDIDREMANLIVQKSHDQGLSLNKTIKKLLEQALGIRPAERGIHRKDFAEFAGAWSKDDFDHFMGTMKACRRMDKEDWE
ncbi:MAG: hypothetical protein A2268_07135 [Candidatus Raymondbacteria bacterium RifOxyA12_full_50_37]|uniref:Antitoxin n=1 Tax=Candidatus Raymondbacteria bacterium RIFOXYD12_FULL_49_13 TaxID=1817890 RepID=A0A1F7FEH5_UNCRA|nr:MAG: hypothetical protein A2350_11075 [Candidatus Raymondbacteria bacterium RifOxyB12_full_50_8]OGJ89749.1 MAG: hypothetical protein A2268_07135 [Candidatus Raymondbacteria bacterium RifOxyA12_full_50_37]OGJ91157.1 MAG: hypothetical protein A2248_01280 [Candidatus Raymondbacteria bacterium RIFOXYA2_FULL_49_16]OGJ96293.1 MAG: hypothetical protein A2487_00490 [Candidatus Raymondbacteria bacterium RifOxyC12_full_50_8]OGJ97555.1 MAG: hypothetical protein A2453_02045 [Candidatus Raymondbacteria b